MVWPTTVFHDQGKCVMVKFDKSLERGERTEVEARLKRDLGNKPNTVVEFHDILRDYTVAVAFVRDSR